MFALLLLCMATSADAKGVALDVDGMLAPPAQYGLDQLKHQVNLHGGTITTGQLAAGQRGVLVGTYANSPRIKALVDSGALKLAKTREALAIARQQVGGRDLLVVAGYDDVGLMYALLDLTDELENRPTADPSAWSPESAAPISEQPRNSLRRMRVLLHHAANEKSWYYDKEYWDWYLGQLARNRFNGLNLVFSHQSPYLAPMYAWHVKVDEYPEVRGKGLTDAERDANLDMLRYIAANCRDRGIEFTVGVWQHLPWMTSYLGTRRDQEVLVEGLNGDNVGPYTYLAVKKLLKECPGIARIQLRPNDESGIRQDQQTHFYKTYVMKAIQEADPKVLLDLRTVGVQQTTIQAARDANLGVRTSIKFYGEFMGLPYTPLEAGTRAYSYTNFLQKPMPNPVYNEVWMLGSHRILLWGSESYGREFGRNASYGGTIGFETDGPLAQKGYQQPLGPAWRIFKHPEDEYYKHEMERYWAFFRAVGRFGYDPDTPHEVWMRPFHRRFGTAATAMAKAYESASRVVGLILASHTSDVNMYVWPEISMGGVLGAYNDLRGVDKGLFPSIDDQVAAELAGKPSGLLGPMRLADEFEDIAKTTEAALTEADAATPSPDREYKATERDFRLLADLARFHAYRQREGYLMSKFYRVGDASLLPPARAQAQAALETWKRVTEFGEQYYEKMVFGPEEQGHWKDRTFLVAADLDIIQEAQDTLHTHGLFDLGFDFGMPTKNLRMQTFTMWKYGEAYWDEPRFTGLTPQSHYHPDRGYGFTSSDGLEWTRNPMVYAETLLGTVPRPGTPLPLDLLAGDFVHSKQPFRFRTDLPIDRFRFTFVFADRSAKPTDHGPMNVLSVDSHSLPAVIKDVTVPAGKAVMRQTDRDLRRTWYPCWEFAVAPAAEGADAILSALTIHRVAPNMAHAPDRCIAPGQDHTLAVTITTAPQPADDAGVLSASSKGQLAAARLHYRTDAHQPFATQDLTTEDGFVYRAVLPAKALAGGELEYYFQASDLNGRMTRLPAADTAQTFRVPLTDDAQPPAVQHTPITAWKAGQPMPIEVTATDASGVRAVRVHYRILSEFVAYESLLLEARGDKFVGTIPAEALSPEWDLVYTIEAIDNVGNGCFYPDWKRTAPYVIVNVEGK